MSNDNIFFNVWRNKYLKNLIINQLQLYNLHYHARLFDIEELNKYEFKEYLNSVIITNINDKHIPVLSTYLPTNIKHLEFGDEEFDIKLVKSTFSNCKQLETIKFNDKFNQEIIPESLPQTLKSLEFGFHFNQIFSEHSLPSYLIELKLGHCYNQPFTSSCILPSTLEYLDLGYKNACDLLVGILPSSLKHLKIGNRYNYKLLPGTIPSGIKTIELGGRYNKKFIENVLPKELEILKLSSSFNKSLDNVPISKLKYLYIGKEFNNILFNKNGTLNKIERLEFGKDWAIPNIPSKQNIIQIEYNGNFNQPIRKNYLPPTIKSLILNNHYCKSLGYELIDDGALPFGLYELTVTDLISPELVPSSVKIYNIENGFNKPIDPKLFPSSITHLNINSGFNQTLTQGCFSKMKNLESLKLLTTFNNGDSPLSVGIFPDSLKYLEIGSFFNQNIANSLSYTFIEHLVFGNSFNPTTLKSTQLPHTLKSLFIKNNSQFDYAFQNDSFPQSLELLYLDKGVKQELSTEWLPTKLKYLIVIGNPVITSIPNNIVSVITHGNNNQFINNFKSHFKLKTYLTKLKVYNINYLTNSNNIKRIINKFK